MEKLKFLFVGLLLGGTFCFVLGSFSGQAVSAKKGIKSFIVCKQQGKCNK